MPRIGGRCPCLVERSEAFRAEQEIAARKAARSWAWRRGCPRADKHTVATPCEECPPPFNPWPVYPTEAHRMRAERGW